MLIDGNNKAIATIKTAPYIINQDKIKQQLKNVLTLCMATKEKAKREKESLEK